MNAERSGRPTSRDVLDRSGGAPPAPASNRRILPNRERCLLDTHVAPPHTCVSCHLPRGQAPRCTARHAGHAAWAVRAHARSTYKKSARTSYTFYGAYTLAAGRGPAGGAVRKKHTHARHRAIHATSRGDCRPLQDACIGTKAQPDADPRAAATKTTPMMKTCTSRAHLTSEELTAQHRIALKASAAERRGFTRRRLLGRLLCR